MISGGCWAALAISWFPWDGILWSTTMGTRKPGGGMALEGMQQQKNPPTLAGFLQLQYKTSGNCGKRHLSIKQEGQLKRAALGVRGASAHV